MVKKILILLAFLVFCTGLVQAQDNWFFRGQGGVVFTKAELEQGEVSGTAQFSFVRLIWKDKIGVGGHYWAINNDEINWEDYSGKVYLFSRNPKDNKFQAYLFSGTGITHDENGTGKALGEASFNAGFGLLIPVAGVTPLIEFAGANLIGRTWMITFVAGLQIPLDL